MSSKYWCDHCGKEIHPDCVHKHKLAPGKDLCLPCMHKLRDELSELYYRFFTKQEA